MKDCSSDVQHAIHCFVQITETLVDKRNGMEMNDLYAVMNIPHQTVMTRNVFYRWVFFFHNAKYHVFTTFGHTGLGKIPFQCSLVCSKTLYVYFILLSSTSQANVLPHRF